MRALIRTLAVLAVAAAAQVASAATITIQVNDPAGQGFNDTTPVAAIPTNSGTTRGQQRLNLFEFAAARWAERLDSDVEIVVLADWQGFTSGDCDEFSALLGFAGPETFFSDFPNAPVAATWYPTALVDALAGSEQDPGFPDINASFNPRLDTQANCLGGVGWYYGTDNNPGSKVDLLSVLMHELGHGLGFTGLVDESTGNLNGGQFGIFDRFLYDEASDKFWTQLSAAQRAASAKSEGNLVWNGANVNVGGGALDGGLNTGHVRMYDPNPIEPGSSVSHFDVSADPDVMMEPFISDGLPTATAVDLTTCLFQDMGWTILPPFGCPDYRADLQVVVSDTADPVEAGVNFTYNLLVTNNGPAKATNVIVTSSASGASVNVSAVSSSQGGCAALPCNLGTIANGGSATVFLTAAGSANGTATRNASVDANQTDVVAGNNADSETTAIQASAPDTSPDAFTFPAQTNVATGTIRSSAVRTISGVNAPATVSVSGGSWQKNGAGGFITGNGTVVNGDTVRVRHTASDAANDSVTTTLTVGDYATGFTSTTGATDTSPAAFTFPVQTNVATGTIRSSAVRTISGVNSPATVSVSGGSWQKNGAGGFITGNGTVVNGDTIRLRHTSSVNANSSVITTITVGSYATTFTSTTGSTDTTPDAFTFPAQTNVATGTIRSSVVRTMAGLNTPTPVSVVNGTWQKNGSGGFISGAGTVVNGDTIRLRHTSSVNANSSVTTTVTVGSYATTFTSTTGSTDTTPNAFTFPAQTGVPTGSIRSSAVRTISGVTAPVPVSVSGGTWQKNGAGGFTSEPGTVNSGDTVRVRHTSSVSANKTVTTTLTVGGVATPFTSTTGANDTTPAAFTFTDQTNVAKNSLRTSATRTITGINAPTPISVVGGAYQVNGTGAFLTTAGTVNNGDTVRVQHTASASGNTTVTTTLTVGGVSVGFSSTTAP